MSDLKKIHNDGQTDASKGEYNPPHDLLSGFFSFIMDSGEKIKELRDENDAYNEGYTHTESQKK